MRQQSSIPLFPSRAWRAFAVGMAGLVAVTVTACGGGSSSSPPPASSTAGVVPPDFTLQGCTYEFDNKVPAEEPQGVKPGFPTFAADASATAALLDIKHHGGTAMVDSVTLPGGTDLYAGPDAGGRPVGVVPTHDSVLAAEPVVWSEAHAGTWLAFYLSCGGRALYWASIDRIDQQDPSDGSALATQIAQLKQAAPYTRTDMASLLPIVVNGQHQLAFADRKVTFLVGRGELTDLPA